MLDTSRYYTQQLFSSFFSSVLGARQQIAFIMAFAAVPRQATTTIGGIFSKAQWIIAFIDYFASRTLAMRCCVIGISIFTFIVQPIVFCCRHYLQVFNSIVSNVFIDVMNIFMARQLTSKMLLHNMPMLKNAYTINFNFYIPIFRWRTLPQRVAMATLFIVMVSTICFKFSLIFTILNTAFVHNILLTNGLSDVN